MSRCQCCNRVVTRVTGMRTLPTGEKVEETFCKVCRNEVNKMLLGLDDNARTCQFEGIVEQQMFYGAMTPQKNPSY